MEGKNPNARVVVVTGANKGLGYYTVKALLEQSDPLTIILTARDTERGQKAVEDLRTKNGSSTSSVVFEQLDVADDKNIADFADRIKSKYGRVDVLINNAGIASFSEDVEPGLATLQTNVTGLINTTEKLLPHLADDGKVLNVTSGLGVLDLHKKNVQDVLQNEKMTEKEFHDFFNKARELVKEKKQAEFGFAEKPASAYLISKAFANTYNRFILPRKLKGEQTCIAIDPGYCATDLNNNSGYRTPEKGAETTAWLVTLPFKRDPKTHGQFMRDKELSDYKVDHDGLEKMGFTLYKD